MWEIASSTVNAAGSALVLFAAATAFYNLSSMPRLRPSATYNPVPVLPMSVFSDRVASDDAWSDGGELPATASMRWSDTNSRSVYGREFWCTYVSNTALMVAISLMYRYANFVEFLGGNEWNVGLIVGVGMVGSLE